jgi:hypothetical protein
MAAAQRTQRAHGQVHGGQGDDLIEDCQPHVPAACYKRCLVAPHNLIILPQRIQQLHF